MLDSEFIWEKNKDFKKKKKHTVFLMQVFAFSFKWDKGITNTEYRILF